MCDPTAQVTLDLKQVVHLKEHLSIIQTTLFTQIIKQLNVMVTTKTERDDFAYSDHLNAQNIPQCRFG